jgi:hypothetical protein
MMLEAMMNPSRALFVVLFAGSLVGSVLACDSSECDSSSEPECPPDLPTEWGCAEPLEVLDQNAYCTAPYPETSVALSGDDIVLIVEGALFREDQSVCAYQSEASDPVQVLLQPCDMNPEVVLKSDCVYAVLAELSPEGGSEIDVFRRSDFHGDAGPVLELLGSVSR